MGQQVVLQVKLPSVIQQPICTLVSCLASPLAIQLPANNPGKAVEDGPNTWMPASHVRNPDEAPGCWRQPALALNATTIWVVNQQMKASLFQYLCLFVSERWDRIYSPNANNNWGQSRPNLGPWTLSRSLQLPRLSSFTGTLARSWTRNRVVGTSSLIGDVGLTCGSLSACTPTLVPGLLKFYSHLFAASK